MGWSGQGKRASDWVEMKSYALLWFWPWLQAKGEGLHKRMRRGRRRRCKKKVGGGLFIERGCRRVHEVGDKKRWCRIASDGNVKSRVQKTELD